MCKNSTLYIVMIVICGICFALSANAADDSVSDAQYGNTSNALKINVKKSFAENLAANSPQDKKEKDVSQEKTNDESSKVERPETETWLRSLITKGTSEILNYQDKKAEREEKKRLEKARLNKRSNAAYFDISGIKLRMSPSEIEKILTDQGYRQILQDKRIPNFIKWRSDEICRIHGIIGFERLNICSQMIARENGFEYVAMETYNRSSTKETITVLYTSTFTDNLSHYIIYKSEVPISTSKASPHVYINNLKVYDFWRRIDLRYGPPDNTSEVKWGLGGKKPYLKATTGNLELVDPVLKDLDSARMLNEDSRLANIPYYNF